MHQFYHGSSLGEFIVWWKYLHKEAANCSYVKLIKMFSLEILSPRENFTHFYF